MEYLAKIDQQTWKTIIGILGAVTPLIIFFFTWLRGKAKQRKELRDREIEAISRIPDILIEVEKIKWHISQYEGEVKVVEVEELEDSIKNFESRFDNLTKNHDFTQEIINKKSKYYAEKILEDIKEVKEDIVHDGDEVVDELKSYIDKVIGDLRDNLTVNDSLVFDEVHKIQNELSAIHSDFNDVREDANKAYTYAKSAYNNLSDYDIGKRVGYIENQNDRVLEHLEDVRFAIAAHEDSQEELEPEEKSFEPEENGPVFVDEYVDECYEAIHEDKAFHIHPSYLEATIEKYELIPHYYGSELISFVDDDGYVRYVGEVDIKNGMNYVNKRESLGRFLQIEETKDVVEEEKPGLTVWEDVDAVFKSGTSGKINMYTHSTCGNDEPGRINFSDICYISNDEDVKASIDEHEAEKTSHTESSYVITKETAKELAEALSQGWSDEPVKVEDSSELFVDFKKEDVSKWEWEKQEQSKEEKLQEKFDDACDIGLTHVGTENARLIRKNIAKEWEETIKRCRVFFTHADGRIQYFWDENQANRYVDYLSDGSISIYSVDESICKDS